VLITASVVAVAAAAAAGAPSPPDGAEVAEVAAFFRNVSSLRAFFRAFFDPPVPAALPLYSTRHAIGVPTGR